MKYNMLMILTCSCFISCKIPAVAFNEDLLNMAYVKQLSILAGGYRGHPDTDPYNRIAGPEDTVFSDMRLYVSTLADVSMLRNHLIEQTIRPIVANPSDMIEPFKGNEYRLYMAVMDQQAGSLSVYVPAIFNPSGKCLRIGPSWIGTWNAGEFSFYKALQHQPDRREGPGKWIYDHRENEDRRTRSILLHGSGGALRKQSVRFVTDQISYISSLDSFKVVRIFKRAPSQIGADKGVLFDVSEIFQDSNALQFKRIFPK